MQWWSLPFPQYNTTTASGVASLIVAAVVVGLLIHVAARLVIKKDDIHRALLAGVYGMLAAFWGFTITHIGILAFLFALALFVVVILIAYRTKLPQAIAVGAVAWVTWLVANALLHHLQLRLAT